MKIYVTFGQTHTHSVNGKTFDKDVVAEINCQDYEDGRKKAFEYFNGVFATTYTEDKITDDFLDYFPHGIIQVN